MNGSPTVDAHQHFWWNPTEADYPWMTGPVAPIRRTYAPEDLEPVLAECGIDRTILVQTRSSQTETRRFLELAARIDFIAGVVGWVDLMDTDVAATIRELRAAPGGEYLVGVRHQVHDEVDPAWLLRDDVQRGLQAIGEADLAYDLLVRTRELPAALEVARNFPNMRFVIDHVAKPPIAAREIDAWAEAMAPFGDLGNVCCKLSGMVTEARWTTWTSDDLAPYVERVVRFFGSDRLLFGSDWPVCLLAASYRQVVEACRSTLRSLPESAQQSIFGLNAVRVYRLDRGR
ncbi:MAG TPA: amidohydrolase family protein [Chloroflexota bacterium]